MRFVSPFTELLANEPGEVERFRRVEERLRRSALKLVPKAVRLHEQRSTARPECPRQESNLRHAP
jgi:hypothetical protein